MTETFEEYEVRRLALSMARQMNDAVGEVIKAAIVDAINDGDPLRYDQNGRDRIAAAAKDAAKKYGLTGAVSADIFATDNETPLR